MSTIMQPAGSVMGKPAPIAAAIGFFDQMRFARPASIAASWTARRSTSVTPDGMPMTHARFRHDGEALVHLTNEVVEHQLRDVKIADHPIFERPHRDNVGRGSADHAFGIGANAKRPLGFGVDGDHRRFINDDALARTSHERIRRAEIDADVTGEHPHDTVERIAQRHKV